MLRTCFLPGPRRLVCRRFVAEGGTYRGVPPTREQLANAAVWDGGDQPYSPPVQSSKDDLCRLFSCLLGEKNLSRKFEKRLKAEGIDLKNTRVLQTVLRRAGPQETGTIDQARNHWAPGFPATKFLFVVLGLYQLRRAIKYGSRLPKSKEIDNVQYAIRFSGARLIWFPVSAARITCLAL
jgi:hypothetical protein